MSDLFIAFNSSNLVESWFVSEGFDVACGVCEALSTELEVPSLGFEDTSVESDANVSCSPRFIL